MGGRIHIRGSEGELAGQAGVLDEKQVPVSLPVQLATQDLTGAITISTHNP